MSNKHDNNGEAFPPVNDDDAASRSGVGGVRASGDVAGISGGHGFHGGGGVGEIVPFLGQRILAPSVV